MQPISVGRVGVQHINKIVTPQETVAIDEFFKCVLSKVSGLPARLNILVSRVEYTYSDGVRLLLSQWPIETHKDHVGSFLDFGVNWENNEPGTRDEA